MLRKITDQDGDVWEIARGHESYGAMVILFCRRSDQKVMKSYIQADNALDADREIDALSDQALRLRLNDAQPGP